MSSKKGKNKNIHAGSNFDNFLKEEGIFEHCQEVGAKYAFVMQLQDEIKKQQLPKKNSNSSWAVKLSPINLQLDQ